MLHKLANSAYLCDFMFHALPIIAGWCVRVRVKLGSGDVGAFVYLVRGRICGQRAVGAEGALHRLVSFGFRRIHVGQAV